MNHSINKQRCSKEKKVQASKQAEGNKQKSTWKMYVKKRTQNDMFQFCSGPKMFMAQDIPYL